MTKDIDRKAVSIEAVNAELGAFKSLASDPTTLPSVKSTIVVGVMLAVALVSRASQ